jgi:hypothetical protein
MTKQSHSKAKERLKSIRVYDATTGTWGYLELYVSTLDRYCVRYCKPSSNLKLPYKVLSVRSDYAHALRAFKWKIADLVLQRYRVEVYYA